MFAAQRVWPNSDYQIIGDPLIPGPATRQLLEAYCRFVDYDFVAQYLKRLG